MNPLAKDTIHRAAILLQDMSAIRWSTDELVGWLNDGQREVQRSRPDVTARTEPLALKGGARQDLNDLLPTLGDPANLMKLIRNAAPTSNMRILRKVSRDILDVTMPNWMLATPSINTINYTYDELEPTVFYVYPPAPEPEPVGPPIIAPAIAVVQYSVFPEDVAMPGAGKLWSDVEGTIDMDVTWAGCLLDYIMYRAFTKDSEYAGNGQRAQAHYQQFQGPLTAEAQGGMLVQPKTKVATP